MDLNRLCPKNLLDHCAVHDRSFSSSLGLASTSRFSTSNSLDTRTLNHVSQFSMPLCDLSDAKMSASNQDAIRELRIEAWVV